MYVFSITLHEWKPNIQNDLTNLLCEPNAQGPLFHGGVDMIEGNRDYYDTRLIKLKLERVSETRTAMVSKPCLTGGLELVLNEGG